jgi:hypothetical protein
MGSKNMGPALKKYVEQNFKAGKRDLYAAFILRNLELAVERNSFRSGRTASSGDPERNEFRSTCCGRVAMVTQQAWMFLRSFAELRAVDQDQLERLPPDAFRGLLRDATLETLAHLGPAAFGEISGEVVNTVLFTLSNTCPPADHRLTALRLIGPKSPEEKDALLRQALRGQAAVATM